MEEAVTEEFIRSRKAYGTRKIKQSLRNQGIQLSRRKIGQMMNRSGLQSSYTLAHYEHHAAMSNEVATENSLNRNFLRSQLLEAIITDLTYVVVGKNWQYICVIIDLFNREILGYSCGEHKEVPNWFSRLSIESRHL